jgi:hypothetical protein
MLSFRISYCDLTKLVWSVLLTASVNSLECRVDKTYDSILQGILISHGKIFPRTPKAHYNSFYLNWILDIQVLPRPRLIFPSKTWFSGSYLNFQWQNSLQNQYFSHSESKSYQINSIKILLIKIFSTTSKAHSNSSYDLILFWVKKSFNIPELLHCKSKHHGTKRMYPSSSLKAFQRPPTTRSQASRFCGSHNYKTKQTTFLHR